uniref:LINE-1 retrotransposable element ORF2 protein n=1 Tax=Comamonas testosteroni TaxID=285 RepID=A0A6H1Q1Y4_COMTE|nr:LINE-1 retrotransposable element ORF2 protein [Comamonas testosteroni]
MQQSLFREYQHLRYFTNLALLSDLLDCSAYLSIALHLLHVSCWRFAKVGIDSDDAPRRLEFWDRACSTSRATERQTENQKVTLNQKASRMAYKARTHASCDNCNGYPEKSPSFEHIAPGR